MSIGFCLHTVKFQNSSISNNSGEHTRTVLFQTIQFSLVLFNPWIGPYQSYYSDPEWT